MNEEQPPPPMGENRVWTLSAYIEKNEALRRADANLQEERFTAAKDAVNAALVAQKELVSAAFASSEKAIVKAEEAQKSYNSNHNDLTRMMDQQYERMIPRTEAIDKIDGVRAELSAKLDVLRGEVGGLRESRSAGEGKSKGVDSSVALAISGVMMLLSVIGLAFTVYRLMSK